MSSSYIILLIIVLVLLFVGGLILLLHGIFSHRRKRIVIGSVFTVASILFVVLEGMKILELSVNKTLITSETTKTTLAKELFFNDSVFSLQSEETKTITNQIPVYFSQNARENGLIHSISATYSRNQICVNGKLTHAGSINIKTILINDSFEEIYSSIEKIIPKNDVTFHFELPVESLKTEGAYLLIN